MNKLWRTYAAKYDALSLRERAMVFIAVVAVPVFLLYILFIEPAVARRQALAVKMAQQQIALQALQLALQTLEKQRADPDAAQTARRDDTRRHPMLPSRSPL